MSTSGLDLTATVDANVTGYERGLLRAEEATNRYAAGLDKLAADQLKLEKSLDDHATAALKRQHDAMDKTGKAMLLFGAVGVAAFAMATDQAVKWEYAWRGVQKTVSGNAEQMGVLEQQLRDLTKVLPASHEEIAAVAEAAGQLGVQRENVANFTKVMINMGQATNLSADDAATAIAQFMNVMQSVPSAVDNIGNTLVALGNKGASTESEIMMMAQRLAGSGKLIGASESDVLGMAAAMANLGIQAQLGGGAMQRTLLTIYSLMKGGQADVQKLSDVAGVSAQKFAHAWETDPMHAVDLFVKGLGHVKDSGGNVVQTLSDLGISGTQNLSVLLRLAGAGDMLTKSLNQSSTAWDKNNALVREVELRYNTTAAQIEIARNQLVDASIDIGNMLLPALAAVVSTGRDLIAFWQDLPGPVKTAATVIGLVATALALVGGAALVAVPKIAAFRTAVAELEAGALKTAGTKLEGMAGVLAGPWGAALAGGVIALGYFAAKHEEAKRQVQALADTLDQETGAITDNTKQMVINNLEKTGALANARSLGINLGLVTAAALGNTGALAKVNAELSKYNTAATDTGWSAARAAVGSMNDQDIAARELNGTLNAQNSELTKATDSQKLKAAADRQTAGATKGAAAAQKGTTQAWKDGASAAGDLTQEVKTLGSELQDASGDYLSNRDAGRQVRDQLRSITQATHEYIKAHGGLAGAFKAGTKSGDNFAGLLDQLAKDYQSQIDTTEKVSGSQKRVQAVYDESRKRLLAVATQMGLTKQQAENYVTQVLQVPAVVQTHFMQPGIDGATQGVQNYKSWLDGIPSEVITHIQAIHDPSIGGGNRPPANSQDNPPPKSGNGGGASTGRWYNTPAHRRHASGSGGGASRGGTTVHVHGSDSPLQVSGTLDTPWGPAEVHGIATSAAQRVVDANHDHERAMAGG